MRVLMCNSFFYLRGGAERCVLDLTELLSTNGHEVIPFSVEHERNRQSEYSHYWVSHIDFPSQLGRNGRLVDKLRVVERVLYSGEAKRKIEQLIRETKPDIAHVHGIAHETSPSILPAIKKAGIPIVQTLHDYKLLCPNTNFLSSGGVCERCRTHRYYNVVLHRCKRGSLSASFLAGVEMYFHKLLQIYERNVDLFIAPSRFLQDKLREYGVGNPVVHLPNSVDVGSFQPQYASDGYFIYFGRLSREKGVGTLLEAVRRVDSPCLYIAGTGELEGSLREYVTEKELSGVSFVGHLARRDLVALIQGAAFTVVPSEWYENYPMSVLESFACGTPVIGASIGGIPELVQDGWNGLLFEPGNSKELAEKIQFLLGNRQQAVSMGRNGRQQVEQVNDPEDHYRKTVEIYVRLLKEGGTAWSTR